MLALTIFVDYKGVLGAIVIVADILRPQQNSA
jgi:hypothetical protein